ncbi:hypothetical protein GI374_15070 [Paracoccus sp. S-4012]|uniref:type II toxin-antitoxin system RelE/ParE family toxin n=1 Tax=Paracoccus sp. S-4012 TaxID=2665648 RepID=UPI0012B103BD|nr:type II toxin-antitoxin system RelE/ParE family toxin [Paracoccus sp. S-4012]MRX51724.1 hypothetical protein [Paracoccus sp. S-4012]
MAEVVLTGTALADLDDIFWTGLTTWGPTQAKRYARDLESALRRIGDNPLIERSHDELGAGLRRLVHESHLIFYRVDGDSVLVLRCLHHSMDAARHLGHT